MKWSCVIVWLGLIVPAHVHAQVLIGPMAGPQVSWVSFAGSNSTRYDQRWVTGYHAGANLSFRVHKQFFLHTSVLYSLKGKTFSDDDNPLFNHKARYHFIDVPIAYTTEFVGKAGNKQYKWFVGLGPHISYLLKGTGTLETPTLHEFLIYEIDYDLTFNDANTQSSPDQINVPDANRIQLGLNITAGVVFEPVRYQKVMVMLRYKFGHSRYSRADSDVVLEQVSDYEESFRVRNQGFRLSLAYLFDLRTDQRKRGKSTIDRRKL